MRQPREIQPRSRLSVLLAGLVGLADRVRSKWGIYRSIKDSADLANTYLLLTDMKAYRWQ